MQTELTWQEVHAACQVALFRHIKNSAGLLASSTPYDFFANLNSYILTCLGEIACAKKFNMYWTGIKDMGTIDVGGKYKVRTASRKDKNHLIIYDTDEDKQAFVLAVVTDNPLVIKLEGWLQHAREGKLDKYLEDPSGKGKFAYYVPKAQLRSMEELISLLPK